MKRLLAITVIAVILFAVLLWLPEWMSNQYQFDHVKDWAAQVTANRAMLVNLMGGLAVAVTIYFTYRNFKVAEDKSITDVFSKAIEQLGSSDVSVRLGGIHSLARIARSSKEDYFPIMQILTGYLRHDGVPRLVEGQHGGQIHLTPLWVAEWRWKQANGQGYWPRPRGHDDHRACGSVSR